MDILVTVQGGIARVDAYGRPQWFTPLPMKGGGVVTISIADMEGDGVAEIIVSGSVLNADGSIRWTHPEETGGRFPGSFAADVDGDGLMEVVLGGMLLEHDGSERWRRGLGGWPATVDLDLDGRRDLLAAYGPINFSSIVDFRAKLETDFHGTLHPFAGGMWDCPLSFKDVLDEQVKDLRRRKEACQEKRMDDAKRELEEWKVAMDAEKRAVADAREDARRRGADVAGFNNVFDRRRAKVKAETMAHDLTLLDYALRCEKADDAKDEAKVAHEKEMALRYKSYLDGFEKVKEVDEARVNADRLVIENRIWEAKDKEQRDQIEARLYLMAQVDLGRKQQMADKAQAAIEERAAYGAEIQAIRDQQEAANRDEDRKRDLRLRAARANQAGVRQLMVSNAKARAEAKQAEYLEARLMDKVEMAHAKSVANEGGIVNTHHPLQSTKWYT